MTQINGEVGQRGIPVKLLDANSDDITDIVQMSVVVHNKEHVTTVGGMTTTMTQIQTNARVVGLHAIGTIPPIVLYLVLAVEPNINAVM
ncbi:MAG: hypothetical protein EBY29_13135 [Planctomycetes bacterium]|nr:hypothetical protein [Planctomycetota bacterium]